MAVLRRFVRVWLWLLIVGGALALWAISVVQQEDAKETAAQERKARAEQATAAPLRWATPAPAEPDYDKYGNPRGSRMYRAGR